MIIAFGSQGQHSRGANCYSRESRLFNLTCFRVLRAEWLHLTSIPGLASSAGSGNTKLDKTRNIFTASESQMAVCCFAMRANCENNHDFRAHLRNSFFLQLKRKFFHVLLIETHFWSKLKHHLITNSKCTVSQDGRFWFNQRGILCLGLAAPCSSGIRSWRLDSPTPAHFSTRSASQSQILCFICKTSAFFSPKNLLTQLRTNSPTWEPFLSAENHFSHLGTF